jgi:hypothetical protein
MKGVLCLTALLCSIGSSLLTAQNVKKGYIVSNQNDTIGGVIKERLNMSEKVSFKKEREAEFQEYLPVDLKSFYVEKEGVYESVVISKTEDGRDFLNVLAKGYATLYLTSEKGRDVYYLRKGDELIKITKKDSIGTFKSGSSEFFREDNRYKGLIMHYLGDCPAIKNKLNNVSFSPGSLTKIVETYNNCKEPDKKEVIANSKPIKTHYGFKLGGGSRTLHFQPQSVHDGDYKSEFGYIFGGFVNFTYKNSFALQPELLINKKGTTGTVPISANWNYTNKVSITYLELPINLMYSFNTKYCQPYLLAGMVFGQVLSKDSYGSYIDFKGDLRTKSINVGSNSYGFRFGVGGKVNVFNGRKIIVEGIFDQTYANWSSTEEITFKGLSLNLGMEF